MTYFKFVKKIRKYAVFSFLIPLIAINLCLILYISLGNMKIVVWPNLNYNKAEYAFNEYSLISSNYRNFTFTNCPKYRPINYFITNNDQTIKDSIEDRNLIDNLTENNKIVSVIIKYEQITEKKCVKNYPFVYSVLKKFTSLEKILIIAAQNNYKGGFAKVKNPYFFGEVSISRTARYYPATLIFKPLIIISAFLLFLYWKNTLNLFNELRYNNILDKFSKNFFYLGILSCIFLILHAIFLGLDFDSRFFAKVRRLIIILFILFEISAQILLTKNIFIFKERLKEYIDPLILKIKIIFVSLTFFITCVALAILTYGEPSTKFKHTLEWNYFAFLLFYYLLSRLLWRKP